MTQAWKKAEETLETAVDTGDILVPLRRIRMQYVNRALKHIDAGHTERAMYYTEQAENVGSLIDQ